MLLKYENAVLSGNLHWIIPSLASMFAFEANNRKRQHNQYKRATNDSISMILSHLEVTSRGQPKAYEKAVALRKSIRCIQVVIRPA